MKKNIYTSFIFIGCILFFTLVDWEAGEAKALQSQVIGWSPDLRPFPILQDNNGTVVLAGSIPFGAYPEGSKMSNLLPRLEGLSDRLKYQLPEYLLSALFLAKKDEDLSAITALYEPGDSVKQAQKQYANIKKIATDLQTYPDLQFVNKSLFGPYVNIGYYMLKENGKKLYWSETAKLVNGKYSFTYDINNLHIFTLFRSRRFGLTYRGRSFVSPNVEDMRRIIVYADPQGELKGKVICALENEIPESVNNYLSIYTLTIYAKIHLYPKDFWLFGADTDVKQLKDPEVEFMRKVVETYREGDDNDVLDLWTSKARKVVEQDLQYGEVSRTASLRLLFSNKIKVMGKINTPNGAVLYWRAFLGKGKQGPVSTFFLDKRNRRYFLMGGLEDNYYASQILQNTVMSRAIELWISQRVEAKK